MRELKIGSKVWVPCDVKPGPFSDERVVRVQTESGEYLAFVSESSLQEPIKEGSTHIMAKVTEVNNEVGKFLAKLPGVEITSNLSFEGRLNKVDLR